MLQGDIGLQVLLYRVGMRQKKITALAKDERIPRLEHLIDPAVELVRFIAHSTAHGRGPLPAHSTRRHPRSPTPHALPFIDNDARETMGAQVVGNRETGYSRADDRDFCHMPPAHPSHHGIAFNGSSA